MASTYFHGTSEIQADGLQTLYLMNPNYVAYSDTHHPPSPSNLLFLNPAIATRAPPPPHNHHLLGTPIPMPLPTVRSPNSDDPSPSSVHEFPATLHMTLPRFHCNLWGCVDQSQPAVPPAATNSSLSLSLLPQQPAAYAAAELDITSQAPAPAISPPSGDEVRVSGNSSSSVSNGISGVRSVILGSKYLKAAQQLLDEVVNVGKAMKTEEGSKEKTKTYRESIAVAGDGLSGGESSGKRGADLTTAQRQELQMKKAKLINMLDGVEQRYRQYQQQMQLVVSSFEQAAAFGSAKSYTALALRTISKQFRCLKDAITAQIKATGKSLGEEDCVRAKVEGSRLKFVDHHLRQQRALQQLGMIPQNAWRPQRGLPERAVSILRAWLFEHFLHPYPKDSDKQMLAKQTGLTRSQVSNWFINARVRLWKPMVEEMYLEETKDQEQKGSEDNAATKGEPSKESGSISTAPQSTSDVRTDTITLQSNQEKPPSNHNVSSIEYPNCTISSSPIRVSFQGQSGNFVPVGSSDLREILQRSPKKPRNTHTQNSPSSILSMDMDMKSTAGEASRDIRDHSYSTLMAGQADHHGIGFSSCLIGDQIERLYTGNSTVSLTLGRPHCENLSLSGTQHSYLTNQSLQLGRRLDMGDGEPNFCSIIAPQPSYSNTTAGYERLSVQDTKRFAAQLLPDFVA
ncbi:BEL1-like homeodomain protein 1 [Malania oleifera]|uniref:BEL1-like homeodomain protein 1 n=1 Tax=Malania oleifera TaxID=397392 RepID=UPI0025AE4A70|nr:BEL1-like homeodomain protein 1 [Malania oleifera]XP_057956340.1 BEL1-like homeodomain protein 1 [Malania oleifera]XP_057956341.1 BEL1-like homeodomain protein 1 [Malania oleifera]XP_057956342.1 BEL1-like homeodomain protein 1 [Malania oleifera]XP_057956344.1 BEL1-like homeodomain protein 1 [Malania oleifera]XP_057956345.1 BEL1-like homeodomain protein 1 [Malania oleifera]